LDGSKLAETALPHAESLASRYDATLLLLSVVNTPTINRGPGMGSLQVFEAEFEARRQEAEQYLQKLSNSLSKRNIRSETVVGLEPVVRSIVAQAKQSAVDLVVIASHGRGGLGRVFFGSVAAGVLNRIEQPLMVIRSAS
jgi:nucleotide-binding universal stress UspA family protein